MRRVIFRCGIRGARSAEAPASDAIDVVVCGELRRKDVEAMSVIAETCKKNERSARAAPVQDLKLYVLLHFDKLYFVRRRVGLRRRVLGQRAKTEDDDHSGDYDPFQDMLP